MSIPIDIYYNTQLIKAVKTVSYTTNMDYQNDLAVNYYYTVQLNGEIFPESQGSDGIQTTMIHLMDSVNKIKNAFNDNGGSLNVYYNNSMILYAVDAKVKSINFSENANNWSKSIPFTIELDFNHLHMGEDLENTLDNSRLNGGDDLALADNFASPFIVDIENHKIKEFSENFSIDMNDGDAFAQNNLYTYNVSNNLVNTSKITNSFFMINYTLSAKGKHDVSYVDDNGISYTTLPAWESAKRFVHKRLYLQTALMFNNFLGRNEFGSDLSLLHIPGGDSGPTFNLTDTIGGIISYGLFNETVSFDVSESDGTFSVQYNAMVKQHCPNTENNIGCSDNTIHTVNKSISRSFSANEETNSENQDITITINGEIKGLVPGRSVETISLAPLQLNNPYTSPGTFLIRSNTIYDKNDYANDLLLTIFNPVSYDFTTNFKTALGITPQLLAINNATNIKPSKMNLTRNFLQGTINYTAEYNNKYNCSTSHFEVQVNAEMPVPVVAEFVIPNNNVERQNGTVCASGYNVIQKLGTQTAKKISVNINGNLGFDLGKCCLGNTFNTGGGCDESLDLLNLNYFSIQNFVIPSGVVIPTIGSNYVLINKQKTTSFPKGDFSISLEYVCADVCSLDYFENK
jgi:hypothetical protein